MQNSKSIYLKRTVIALALSTMCITTSLVLASPFVDEIRHQKQTGHPSGKMFKHFDKMVKQLELTEDQQQQIKAIHKEKITEDNNSHLAMKSFRDETKILIEQDIFDEQAFVLLHEKYQPALIQRALEKAKNRHKMMKILTNEQKRKWLEMKQPRESE